MNNLNKKRSIQEVYDLNVDEKEPDKKKQKLDYSKKVAYLLIGSTGTGKSSITNLFCKDNMKSKVSNGSESCTKEVLIYEHNNNNDIIIIDTEGYEDSHKKADEIIMKDIIVACCKQKIQKVYIIWCVEPRTREVQTLQKQAHFINCFKKTDIWNSVVLIIKKGDMNDSQGAMSAARNNGLHNNKTIPCVAFKCIDWLNENEKKTYESLSQEHRDCLSVLSSIEAKDKIEQCIKSLKEPTQIIFSIQECKNCLAQGDERCFKYIPCHYKKELFHPKNNLLIHSQNLIHFHPQQSCFIHDGQFIFRKIHPNINNNFEFFHSGKIVKEFYHPEKIQTIHVGQSNRKHKGNWDCSSKNTGHSGYLEKNHPNKCETYVMENGERTLKFKCTSCQKDVNQEAGCVQVYSCCKSGPNTKECTQLNRWTCCGKSDFKADGCCTVYECCSNLEGCKKQYKCCNADASDQGCKFERIYDCCNAPYNENDKSSKGCQDRYNCCKKLTGEEGCIDENIWSCCKSTEHGSIGCTHKFMCCGKTIPPNENENIIQGCENKYKCCNLVPNNNDNNDNNKLNGCCYECCTKKIGTQGCKTKCQKCGKLWGTKDGCHYDDIKMESLHDLVVIQ